MKNNKVLSSEDVIELNNERDISLYNPGDVLEIIYERKSFFNRMKAKGKKIIKNIPNYLLGILTKIATILLNFMGLGSISSVISTYLPVKMILKWALNFSMLFFPVLAPFILAITKFLI